MNENSDEEFVPRICLSFLRHPAVAKNVGILRLRIPIHFVNRYAPLRMTID